MTTVSTPHSNDSWDQPSISSRSNNILRRPAPAQSVPDDWDDDDDDEDDNQKIWEEANTRAPMPELIISSSSTTATTVPPPAIAFQTPMRILKRPSSQNSGSNSPSSQTPIETLAQKEARYQAARERIFGGDEGSGKLKGVDRIQKGSPSPPVVGVVRNPIGPSGNCKDTEGGQESKGFKRRSTKGPGSSVQAASIAGSA